MRLRDSLKAIFVSIVFSAYFYASVYFMVPNQLTMIEGKEYEYPFYSFVKANIGGSGIKTVGSGIYSSFVGKEQINLSLFGVIPLKKVDVNVISDSVVLGGGEIIGMKLNTDGLIVVTFEEFTNREYVHVRPYSEKNIQRGDIITEINGKKITDVSFFIDEIQNFHGNEITLKILRNGTTFEEKFTPEVDRNDGKYKLGFWVKSVTSGVGTVTFIDPETKMFGALGHGINDINEEGLLNIKDGEAFNAMVFSVTKGRKGEPGELRGAMRENDKFGTIVKNSDNGVFGYIEDGAKVGSNEVEIGLKEEIKEGYATIYCTAFGNKVACYDIVIEKVNVKNDGLSKNMIIKITDEDLISETGGIVQGMSGSPIIQNGKLVGAVTHVLVNEPLRGYGVFIENMLNEASLVK